MTLGLTENYAPQINDSTTPDAYAGWGRSILVPAAGTVIIARGDRPDQPVTDVSDEFSMIAHLRQHSLAVAVGSSVAQGDRLGVMGNSGDSTGTHHDRGWYFLA